MSLLLSLIPLIAQVGPFTAPGTTGTPFPARVERPAKAHAVPAPAAPLEPARSARAQACLAAADDNAEDAVDLATRWLAAAKGADKVDAQLCLGLAHSALEDWSEAEQALLGGRDAAGSDRMMRARLGAMAGNAALAGQAPDRALAALETAGQDVKGLASPALEADIALDRARALVALKRDAEAEAALADVRSASPTNPEAWLLSATLARRMGKLTQAQAWIERAAELLPIDPDVGLEAGVIAMLSGHEAAARKSWQSVVAAKPDSAAAQAATGYLAQLDSPSSNPQVPAR
ncbi:MAG: hypothetical protein FP826_14395 [Sphingomonadales bacterium]|nr:hypothetical protein [Sphingomonadales bacterium]MBU3992319.1 hypothetical protein [Alphaproteobacteria bacterium]